VSYLCHTSMLFFTYSRLFLLQPHLFLSLLSHSENYTLIMLDLDAVRTIDITNSNGVVDLNNSFNNDDERIQSMNNNR